MTIDYAQDAIIIKETDWDTAAEIEHFNATDLKNSVGGESKTKGQKKFYLYSMVILLDLDRGHDARQLLETSGI